MKLQKLILCAAAALTSFGASLGLFEIGVYLDGVWQTDAPPATPAVRPKPVPTVIFQPPAAIEPAPVVEASESKEYCDLRTEGDYELFGKNPKGFEDFETVSIVTSRYDDEKNENIPVKPSGSLFMGEEYRFSWVTISGKQISFVTVARRGVTYQFDGRFVEEKIKMKDNGEEYEQIIPLKGRLIKWRKGKKIAEAKVRFLEMCGC